MISICSALWPRARADHSLPLRSPNSTQQTAESSERGHFPSRATASLSLPSMILLHIRASLTHSLALYHTRCLSLTPLPPHTLALVLPHTLVLSHTRTLSLTLILSPPHSFSSTLTRCFSLSLVLSPTSHSCLSHSYLVSVSPA